MNIMIALIVSLRKETIVNEIVLRTGDAEKQEVTILDLFLVWKEIVEF